MPSSKTINWTRIMLLIAFAAGIIGATAFLSNRRAEPIRPPTAPPTELDPALVAQTAARASMGDSGAQLQMGMWCANGQGQKPDDRQAAEWFRKAAEAGNVEAQFRWATLLQAGRGVDRNATNALFWFKQAAEKHHVGALFNLGSMYEAGQGAAPDTHVAARMFQRAAAMGDPYAQYNMARRCEEGHGVPKDLAEAWKWYELAHAGGVADTLHARQSIASRLTYNQLREARRAVASFHSESGVPR